MLSTTRKKVTGSNSLLETARSTTSSPHPQDGTAGSHPDCRQSINYFPGTLWRLMVTLAAQLDDIWMPTSFCAGLRVKGCVQNRWCAGGFVDGFSPIGAAARCNLCRIQRAYEGSSLRRSMKLLLLLELLRLLKTCFQTFARCCWRT